MLDTGLSAIATGANSVDLDLCVDVGVNVVRCGSEVGSVGEDFSRKDGGVAWLDNPEDAAEESDGVLVLAVGIWLVASAMGAS